MFDIELKEYDIEILQAFNMYESQLDYISEGVGDKLGELVSKVIEAIKSIFKKATDFVKTKFASHEMKKQLFQIEEMLGNTPSLTKKKISVPYFNKNAKGSDVKDAIKKKIPNFFYDKDKKITVTIGEAFDYVKENVKNPSAELASTLATIVNEISGSNNAEDARYASEIARNYAAHKTNGLVALIKFIFSKVAMVAEIPRLIKNLFIRKAHLEKDQIKIIRDGKHIRKIKVNGKDVQLVKIVTDADYQSTGYKRGSFLAMYSVGPAYDGIRIEGMFENLDVAEQNAIIYHELGHATSQQFGPRRSKHYDRNTPEQRNVYMADLKKAYSIARAKYTDAYGMNPHFDISEAEADFKACLNGKYAESISFLSSMKYRTRSKASENEYAARIFVLKYMKGKNYF